MTISTYDPRTASPPEKAHANTSDSQKGPQLIEEKPEAASRTVKRYNENPPTIHLGGQLGRDWLYKQDDVVKRWEKSPGKSKRA